jgi:hypothetical protein
MSSPGVPVPCELGGICPFADAGLTTSVSYPLGGLTWCGNSGSQRRCHPDSLLLSADEAIAVVEAWTRDTTTKVSSGASISDTYFFLEAVVKGFASAMYRTKALGIESEWVKATNGDTLVNTIAQYFDVVNGNAVKNFRVSWDADNDFAVNIAYNTWQIQITREFSVVTPGTGVLVPTVAQFGFVVQQRGSQKKFVSLFASPIVSSPRTGLNETVTLPPP